MNRVPLPTPPLPPGRPLLVVAGFMGTGKTAAGRAAAELLELPFVDLDETIEARAGMPVAHVFAARGEDGFRALERRALDDAARLSGAVVATGGGAVLDPAAFARLADGAAVAVLTADPGELARRLGGGEGRPLLTPDPEARIRELLAGRAPAYAAAGEMLNTSGRTVEDVAAELVARHRRAAEGPARIEVPTPGGRSTVLVGAGALEAAAAELPRTLPSARRAMVVADRAVADTVGEAAAAAVRAAGLAVERADLPPGEAGKTLDALRSLWERFLDLGLDRTDVVVAVGGGAALDVAGFAAATFARGLPLMNVPTTLLAMADAAVGGKVAIDLAGAKNMVGTFHAARLVAADPATLATLPGPAVRHGLAEIVKVALLASPLLLDWLETAPLGEGGLPAALAFLVEQAVRIKAAYVAEDPRDAGLRHALNLGHTFAHGIEAASGYRVPHGEAVAAGLVAAARLGEDLGAAPPGTEARLERLLRRLGLPAAPPPDVDARRVRDAMASDKKRRGGQPVFVLPAPGGAELVEGLDLDRALAALFPQGTRPAGTSGTGVAAGPHAEREGASR